MDTYRSSLDKKVKKLTKHVPKCQDYFEKLIYHYILLTIYIKIKNKTAYDRLVSEIMISIEKIDISNNRFHENNNRCCKKESGQLNFENNTSENSTEKSYAPICFKNLEKCDYSSSNETCQFEKLLFNHAEKLAKFIYDDKELDIF